MTDTTSWSSSHAEMLFHRSRRLAMALKIALSLIDENDDPALHTALSMVASGEENTPIMMYLNETAVSKGIEHDAW